MTATKKKASKKKAAKKKVAKKGPDNSPEGMDALAEGLKKGAKKASKKKAPAKKKAAAKKKPVAKAKSKAAIAKAANTAVEKKIVGKTVLGTGKLYMLKPKNIVVLEGFNPRIDMGDMAALMKSIKRNGVKQPITVRKVGKHFELIDGHRRLTAVIKLDLDKIPARLEAGKLSTEEMLNLALVSNDGKPLAPVEEADAFRRLVKGGWTPRAISVATGKSLRLVKDRLTLISAHPDVAAAVKAGKLSVGLGLAIAKKSKKSKKKQAKKVKEATRGATATKRVAAQLGKASLKTRFDKKKIALQNRLNKLVSIVNKRRKKADQMPKQLARQVERFSKHKDKEVRAAFVAGGVYAITDVLAGANAKKTKPRGRTATGKQTRQVRPK
jgi:ParB/RepB/Spo0J family partition protein